ncbi:MAG: hypothetical protein WD049_05600 [Candidatus Paceibacterota bacterium]
MKSALITIILAVSFLPAPLRAQTGEGGGMPAPPPEPVSFPQLEVTNVQLDANKTYRAGEVITGSLQMTNPSDTHLPDLQLWIGLKVFPEGDPAGIRLGKHPVRSVFVPAGTTVTVPFSSVVPRTVPDAAAELYFSLAYPRQDPAGGTVYPITVTGPGGLLEYGRRGSDREESWIEIANITGERLDRFSVHNSPPLFVQDNETATLKFFVRNPHPEPVIVTPAVDIYQGARHPHRSKTTVSAEPHTLSAGEQKLFSISLPLSGYAPGRYRAYLSGTDQYRRLRLPEVAFTYHIGGPTAAVHALLSDREWATVGDRTSFSLFYSTALEHSEQSTLSATVDIYNHNKRHAGTAELTDLTAKPGLQLRTFSIHAGVPSESLSARITLFVDGHPVDTYITKLSSRQYKLPLIAYVERPHLVLLALGALVTALTILFVRRRRRANRS